MKNNRKNVPVKFQEDRLYLQPQISDYHHRKYPNVLPGLRGKKTSSDSNTKYC